MKRSVITSLVALTLLATCAPAPTATPTAAPMIPTPQIIEVTATPRIVTATPQPTDVSTSTPLPTNTASATATATLTSMLMNTPLPTNTGTPRPLALRDLADKAGISIGVALEANLGFYNDQAWKGVIAREFNAAVISVYWQVMMPKEGTIDFKIPDTQLGFVAPYQMEVTGEHLLYPWYLPDWLKNGSYTRQQLINIVTENVKAIASRYRGKVRKWSVVNESVIDNGSTEFFYQHIGPEYIQMAFQAAREADPSALLYYNDWGSASMSGAKYAQTRQIVASLKSKGLIDAVGLQLHIDASQPPNNDDLIRAMQSYGLPVYVSELDVDLRNVSGTDQQRYKLQADIYKNVVESALQSGVCRSIVFWGIGDKYSWLEQPEFNGSPKAQPTLFDDNLNPKPAYFAIRDVLLQYVQK